jgi:DNA-binding phage protein
MATKTKSNDLFALKRQIARSLRSKLERDNVSVSKLAKQIGTGRTAIRRVLDDTNTGITLRTMHKTAEALGLRLVLEARPMSPKELAAIAARMVDAETEAEARSLKKKLIDGFYGDAPSPA